MMPPLVSILIPAYNAQRSLRETIEWAVNQTWPRKEIIIVDDGSSDGTLSVARRFASRTVKVVSQENAGASAARNRAFELCQGDYIQWLDADDLLAPEKIAKQMQAKDRVGGERTLLSSAYGSFVYRPAKAHFLPSPLWCDLPPVEWLLRKMSGNLHMQTATWLVSRELTEHAGLWDTRLSLDDDGEYFSRVLLGSDHVHFVGEAKVYYRTRGPASLSFVDGSDKKLRSQLLSIQLHIDYLRSLERSERVNRACLRYLQSRFINFYPERPDFVAQLQQLAASVGGQLQSPSLGSKFGWIERIVGYGPAKRARSLSRQLKWSTIRAVDGILARIEANSRQRRREIPDTRDRDDKTAKIASMRR